MRDPNIITREVGLLIESSSVESNFTQAVKFFTLSLYSLLFVLIDLGFGDRDVFFVCTLYWCFRSTDLWQKSVVYVIEAHVMSYNKMLLACFVIFSSIIAICYAAYDTGELRNVVYDLEIAEIPLGFENLKLTDELMDSAMSDFILQKKIGVDDRSSFIITSEFGQEFICSLPEVQLQKHVDAVKSNLTVNLISDVVAASFYIQNCIRRNMGWWTYELCYNEHVQQFRLEGSKTVGDIIYLGYYKKDSDINFSEHKSEEHPYFEQIYDDGTVCDLTNKSRRTRVWYMCDEMLSTGEAYIADVDEPSSCQYIVKVKTGSLCKLEGFVGQSVPRKPLPIMCRPLLDQKAAVKYLEQLMEEKRQQEKAKNQMKLLLARAESIQRQRYARKRLVFQTPDGKKEMELAETELKTEYENIMKSVTQLNVDLEKAKTDFHFIYDDVHEMKTRYLTEADEDRGNIYWYFKDMYWDRKFFPLSSFFQKIDAEFDLKKKSLPIFLRNIDEGVIKDTHLTVMIGSLRQAFHENIFPDIVDRIDDLKNSALKTMWINFEKRLELLQLFEYKIFKLLNQKVKFAADDLMSHVARQLILIRTMQSYNRAVSRYNRNALRYFSKQDEPFRFLESSVEYTLENEEVNIDDKNANSQNKKEQAARLRMLERARRKNLRNKFEHYIRTTEWTRKDQKQEKILDDDLNGLREQLLIFKNTLEEKIRETGLVDGVDVKVQLVSRLSSTSTNDASDVEGLNSERVAGVLKAFFLEQDGVTEEENRYDRLARGYTYGADDKAKENVRKNGDEDERDLKSVILLVLKKMLS
ncbi:unnamed protein product [Thelazia callipaeda]|uniref:PRKCSH domain-containing protein n=1 Tax=Thelazia callipaeda TaxID=103827 RepID=A0A0N5D357_THECL|nr:unnamed protein product [Thelazia callipaeda]